MSEYWNPKNETLPRAEPAGHLAEQEAQTPGSRVHDTGVAGLERIRGTSEIVGGQALQQHGRARPGVYANRQHHDAIGRSERALRVRPLDGFAGDASAGTHLGDPGTDLLDGTRGLPPERQRK